MCFTLSRDIYLTPDPPHYLRDSVNRLPNLKGSGLKFGQVRPN